MIDVLHMLTRWLTLIAPYAFALVLGLIITLLLASIVVAIAILFSWAGWTNRRVAQPVMTVPAAANASRRSGAGGRRIRSRS